MNIIDRVAWLQRAAETGLTVLDAPQPSGVPTVLETIPTVANMEVRPVATIPVDHPDAHAEVDRQWLLHARENNLFTSDGKFLISIPGSGVARFGWTSAQWSDDTELTKTLTQSDCTLDFFALSTDGRTVCAVTEEEYEYWIVVHRFSDPREVAAGCCHRTNNATCSPPCPPAAGYPTPPTASAFPQ
jgi:hypothetical protein